MFAFYLSMTEHNDGIRIPLNLLSIMYAKGWLYSCYIIPISLNLVLFSWESYAILPINIMI